MQLIVLGIEKWKSEEMSRAWSHCTVKASW